MLTIRNLSGKIVFADAVIKQKAEAEKTTVLQYTDGDENLDN